MTSIAVPEVLLVPLARRDRGAGEGQVEEEPFRRAAQRALADDVTTLTHGADETERVKAAAAALFGGGDLTGTRRLDADRGAQRGAARRDPDARRAAACSSTCFAETGLVASKSEARRTVGEGGAYVNNERITDAGARGRRPTICCREAGCCSGEGKRNLAGVQGRLGEPEHA